MWLILCEKDDLSAYWAYEGLSKRGITPIELISIDSFSFATRWVQRLGNKVSNVSIKLPDGRQINSNKINGVLNRCLYPPKENLVFFQSSDRHYVDHEMTAFFISWLSALPGPVINRPTPNGLAGHLRHKSEWIFLAALAGLPARQYTYPADEFIYKENEEGFPRESIIIIENFIVGELPSDELYNGCLQLARYSDTSLLEINFSPGPDGSLLFENANPFPDLRKGGTELLDRMAEVMMNNKY